MSSRQFMEHIKRRALFDPAFVAACHRARDEMAVYLPWPLRWNDDLVLRAVDAVTPITDLELDCLERMGNFQAAFVKMITAPQDQLQWRPAGDDEVLAVAREVATGTNAFRRPDGSFE